MQTLRRGRIGLAVLAALGLVAGTVPAAEGKIGYINLAKLFDEYDRTKAMDAQLEKKGQQKDGELQGRVGELKKLREGLELLNDQAREAKAREIEQKTDDLQRFRTSTARDLRRERDKIAQQLLKDIEAKVQDFAKANGFAVILDSRSLLFGQDAMDVTDEVLAVLNNKAAKPAAQSN
jgi:outer membrane protein